MLDGLRPITCYDEASLYCCAAEHQGPCDTGVHAAVPSSLSDGAHRQVCRDKTRAADLLCAGWRAAVALEAGQGSGMTPEEAGNIAQQGPGDTHGRRAAAAGLGSAQAGASVQGASLAGRERGVQEAQGAGQEVAALCQGHQAQKDAVCGGLDSCSRASSCAISFRNSLHALDHHSEIPTESGRH